MLLKGFCEELFSCLSTFDRDSGKEITLKKQECRLDGKEQPADASKRISKECLGLWFPGTCTFDTKEKAVTLWLLIVAQWENSQY